MRSCVVAVVCLCAVGPVEILHAQRLVSLGLAGGVSIPQGDLRDAANTGWHALGTVVVSSPMQPLGLRLDVAYNRFEFNDETGATTGNGYQTVLSATANATYRLPTTDSPLSPYLVSGLGASGATVPSLTDARTRRDTVGTSDSGRSCSRSG